LVDTLDMSEKHKMVMDAAQKGGRSIEQAESYVFAVGALRDTLLELRAIGIEPSERCDAVGYTLINLLTTHHTEEKAFLWAEEFLAMLKRRYDAAKSTTSVSPP
jgi:hypothetical protein